MSFYKGKLKNYNLDKMQEYMGEKLRISICDNGKVHEIKLKDNNLINILKENKKIYCLFGKRKGDYLYCVNNKQYLVDDERSQNSQGIFMADAYFNKYDDINLGFLLSYEDDVIDIKLAIEGEGIGSRRYEIIDNCGDLNDEMQLFINSFII